ncbi:signal peptidase II [Paenibacillus sacheonensis]|uniref:Lipoprotein signal peptidase n=1 Tax=Paenibacillus sacheonensis TaxID=742054 RepID=A0A7X4YW17_9BACL|nr:signal peptidase II [Paenibacillus sacheonensis]MBM7569480.1 signal peptidase II [Paenibacillus sacheonensis]NBC73587.1 signal peptidase II [Paenibacillus sacheonensis]
MAIFYWIALLMTAIDQVTKLIVRLNMNVGDTRSFREGILQFTYYQNSGAAHSSLQGYGRALGLLCAAFIVIVMYYRSKQASNRRWMDVGLAFLVAGAAGNGVERLLFGKVTDFLQFGSGQGIMNIADLCINVGLLVVVVQQIVLAKRTREKPSY